MTVPHRGHHALRAGRRSLPAHAYLLTAVCLDRACRFSNEVDACAAARVLSDRTTWLDAELLAWVLMPDHFHALVVLGERRGLAALMQSAKGRSSHALGQGRLWSAGYHDRALRSDDDLRIAARYVVANPMRAGLVSRLGDYPYWGSAWGEDALEVM